jgi:hypothetical protein
MEDIISQGDQRPPGGWRRRAVLIAALAVILAVVVVDHWPNGGPAAQPQAGQRPGASQTPIPIVGALPDGLAGHTGLWQADARLPRTGTQPDWYWPAKGRIKPIAGLPAYRFGYLFTRVNGGWVVQPQPVDGNVCGNCPGSPGAVYYLADRAGKTVQIAAGTLVAPAAVSGRVWLTSFPPDVGLGTAPGTAREYSGAGTPQGQAIKLPVGYTVATSAGRDLLLVPIIDTPGSSESLWDPVTRRTVRLFSGVIGASADEVAFAPPCTTFCAVQVLNLRTGQHRSFRLPTGNSLSGGVFSPDGRYLALQVNAPNTSYGGALGTQLELVNTRTGQLGTVPDSWVSSDAMEGFGWPASQDALVAELAFSTHVEIAFWRPGSTAPAVALVRPGQRPTDLVVG